MAASDPLAPRLLPAAGYQFCFLAAVGLLKAGSNALVLSRFPTTVLPWLYLGAALITAGMSAVAVWRRSPAMGPRAVAALGALTTLAVLVGLWLKLPALVLVAYLFAETFPTQASLAFWAAATEAFDAREARRAFSLISGLGMAGSVFGGALSQPLAGQFGASGLIAGGGVMLALGAFTWRAAPAAVAGGARAPSPRADAFRWGLRSPYARALAALVLTSTVLGALCDYLFRQRAAEALDERSLAELFGGQQLVTGLVCVIFQLVLAQSLLRRLGVVVYLALPPLVLGLLSVWVAVDSGVWSVWALKLVEQAVSLSILPVAMQLLYAALPDAVRDGLRSAIDGLLRKGGLAVGGVLLLVFGSWARGPLLVAAVLVSCALALLLVWRLRPQYLAALHDRVAGAQASRLGAFDEGTLVQALKDPSPERALRALSLLRGLSVPLGPLVRTLLLHPAEQVQEQGVKLAQQLDVRGVQGELEALLDSGARRPRAEAAWALAQLSPQRARVRLRGALAAADIGVRCAAIGALLSLPEPPAEALQALEALLARHLTAPVAERREVARLLGRLSDPRWAQSLGRCLEDGDASVRRVAIAAVGQGGHQGLAPKLLRFLTWREERRAARDALAALGEPVVPLLAQALDDRSRAVALRHQLAPVLRRIGTQAALEALLFSNARDDAFLHYRVGVALIQLREEHPELSVDRARVLEALERRREVARAYVEPFADLRAALGEGALLTRALGDRLDQAFELSFWLLGLLHDVRGLRRAHAQLVGADPKRRAWALEFLDHALLPDERALVAQQLERPHRQVQGEAARGAERVLALCVSPDPILRATARAVGRRSRLWLSPYKEDDMSEATVQKLFALEGVEIFAQSDVDDLAALAAVAREQRFRRGERIYSEGDPGDAVYVILEGQVEVKRQGERVMLLREKEAFGELSLFDGAPRVTDNDALADTTALVIDRRDFLDLLADRPELIRGVFAVLSRQLKSMVVELSERRSSVEVPAVAAAPRDDGPPVP